jgi:Flp pilus assembly pilin Flp
MKYQFIKRVWREDDGVLSFEWVLLITLLTLGLVSGLTAARDGFIDELGDVAEAMVCLNQSFTVDGGGIWPDSEYIDVKLTVQECDRAGP